MKEKICTVCQKSLPATPEYFYTIKTATKGRSLRSACKECTKKLGRVEKIVLTEKECTKCHMLLPNTSTYFYEIKVNNKTYTRGMCKECTKDSSIDYWDKHRGERLDYGKKYRDSHKIQFTA